MLFPLKNRSVIFHFNAIYTIYFYFECVAINILLKINWNNIHAANCFVNNDVFQSGFINIFLPLYLLWIPLLSEIFNFLVRGVL